MKNFAAFPSIWVAAAALLIAPAASAVSAAARPVPLLSDAGGITLEVRDLHMLAEDQFAALVFAGAEPGLYTISFDGRERTLLLPERGRPFRSLALSGDEIFVAEPPFRLRVVSRDGKRHREIDALAFGLAAGFTVAEEGIFGGGGFAARPCCDGLSIDRWRSKFWRPDCLGYHASLTESGAPVGIWCDEQLGDPMTASFLPFGDVASSRDGRWIYMIAERAPHLFVFDRLEKAGRTVPLAGRRAGDASITSADYARRLAPGFALDVRSRFRWPLGIVTLDGDRVAVVFRDLHRSVASISLDIFTSDGTPVSSKSKVRGIEGGKNMTGIPIDNRWGPPFILIVERTAGGKLIRQDLYRLSLTE